MNLNTIVVATDFSEASLIAAETAFRLALESHAVVYLLHVVEYPVPTDPFVGVVVPSLGQLYSEEMERLQSLIPHNLKGRLIIKWVVLAGSPAKMIARFADQEDADLIVVGTHGRKGLSRMLMGSTAESLLREAPCQVLVVKQKAESKANLPNARRKKAS
ncbi:MAG TPA: universal stress protein [Acidobacteriota bacterium]|jgi:nucleotide-binding universal stress UspA family protein|nr:universal stress protein [Acidobacteriota bacterium]